MAIQRWDPRRDLLELQERMRHLFEEALSRSVVAEGDDAASTWQPPMDLFEEAERFVLRADLPGVAASDVEVQVERGKLFLRGERRPDGDVASESYLRIERPRGRFSAQVALPDSVDPQGIRATQRNGVIEVVLPKRRDDAPNRIEVSTG